MDKIINEIKKLVKESVLYSHCIIEKTGEWELNLNKKNKEKVLHIQESHLSHSYTKATIIYLHTLDDVCIYVGSTIGLFNRMGCISSAGSFDIDDKMIIPSSNGGKNKDTVVKFRNFLKQGKNIKTYAIALYLNDKIKSNNILDQVIRVPLKEEVEFVIIRMFEKLYGNKPLLSQGLDQGIAYGN